ncbi:hypothetical protein D3C87_1416690 [compost metagenome]
MLVGDMIENGVIQIITTHQVVTAVKHLNNGTIDYFAQSQVQRSATPIKNQDHLAVVICKYVLSIRLVLKIAI